MTNALLIRNAELGGELKDVRIEAGRIAAIGEGLPRTACERDAAGGALIPGLHDHHIHLFATAARLASVDLSGVQSKQALLDALRTAAASLPAQDWIRAVAYDDSRIGLIGRADLDAAGLAHPIRVQDRTGALWVLNTHALERVLDDAPPPCVERDASGTPTGRIWRGDAWLRTRLPSAPPSLTGLSQKLASFGITGVTDASVTTGPDEAALLAQARAHGELLQSLYLMSGAALPPSPHYEIGPAKILPDERALPELADIVAQMNTARSQQRRIAVHCVTAAELAITLAAFDAIGALPGDRIEHGGMIPAGLFENIRTLGLIVVTQPAFIFDRGDRYARDISPDERPDLYRLASLRQAGIAIAAGSDAPYGSFDPWRAIQTATDRTSKNGRVLGEEERIAARDALGLYLTAASDPGGSERRIAVGAPADLCLLATPLSTALNAPSAIQVRATIAGGEVIYSA